MRSLIDRPSFTTYNGSMRNYDRVYAPGHPLATKSDKRVHAHRYLLYERIGPGPHNCHWCGTEIDWMPGSYTRPGALVVDHVDRNGHNNAPENLVPSCQPCNLSRTRWNAVKDNEPFILRKKGTRLRGEIRSCGYCGKEFTAWPNDARPNVGKYCSRSCARHQQHKR